MRTTSLKTKSTKAIGTKMAIFWALVVASAVFAACEVYADDRPTTENHPVEPPAQGTKAPGQQSDVGSGEVDISDIQNQYWRAHDKEFEVIQNRQYTKAGRVELAPVFGVYQRVDFQDTKTLGASVGYNFSETWGAELMSYKMFSSDSYTLTQFKQQTGATVDFNAEHYYMGASVLFTPIYGKFELLGKKISHFDLYLAPGIGTVKTDVYDIAPSIAIGQKFWISPNWNFRIEYRIMRYNDTVNATTGTFATKNGGPGSFSDTVTDQNLLFGISYLFN